MLLTPEQVGQAIQNGAVLSLAADEGLLKRLPKGAWIGGTIPYFMSDEGGRVSRDLIFAQKLPCSRNQVRIQSYGVEELPRILSDAPENGFSLIIIPANSEVHSEYARSAPNYKGMFLKPVIGWISGVHLDDLGKIKPKAFNGQTRSITDDQAVVLHVRLPANKIAYMGIVNLFTQGIDDVIAFPRAGFVASQCKINGVSQNFADYLVEKGIDTRLPLVADYSGAKINVSFQEINEAQKVVRFYAPVFDDVEYRIARPIRDYVQEFQAAAPNMNGHLTFSCNCILNFLYSELEGKKTGDITGPMTFGEVAYQLLNQTMVYMTLEDN